MGFTSSSGGIPPLRQSAGICFRLDPELGFSVMARWGRVSGKIMAALSVLGQKGFYWRRRGPRGCSRSRGGPHPRVQVGPRMPVAPGLWVPPGVALLPPVLIFSIKNRRKFSSNSENIFRSNFLQQNQHNNRELALGILSIG